MGGEAVRAGGLALHEIPEGDAAGSVGDSGDAVGVGARGLGGGGGDGGEGRAEQGQRGAGAREVNHWRTECYGCIRRSSPHDGHTAPAGDFLIVRDQRELVLERGRADETIGGIFVRPVQFD